MQADRVEGALGQLGPEDRALIELSFVRGVSDADIASLLGAEPDAVRKRREDALGELAAAAGDGSNEGRASAVEHLRAHANSTEDPAEPRPDPAAPKGRQERRGRRLLAALVGGLAIAALVALVLALAGQNDETPGAGAGRPPEPAQLRPLIPGPATGTGRLTKRGDSTRLRLSVKGLPRPRKGGYEIWLYNSVSDSRPLGGQPRGSFSTDTPLPAGYERYRFVDISREPHDGNRNHSGQSVLRLSVSALPRAD